MPLLEMYSRLITFLTSFILEVLHTLKLFPLKPCFNGVDSYLQITKSMRLYNPNNIGVVNYVFFFSVLDTGNHNQVIDSI